MNSKALGDQGESFAADYLEGRGYTVLERQWKCRFGELDLIARSPEGVLCFVEVKRRGPRSIGLPREAVDSRKQAKLRKTASLYLAASGEDAPARFDVAEIFAEASGALRVEYLESAFE